MTVTLRKAGPADGGLLVAWRNENASAFPPGEPLTLSRHRDWWSGVYELDPSDHLYIVCAGGTPAGCMSLTIRAGSGEIGRVILGDKTRARAGIMSAALASLTAAYGLPAYWLRILPGNTTALRFYERNGFRRDREKGGWLIMLRGAAS